MIFDVIPEELRKLKRWGVYRLEDGKKIPYQPIGGNVRAKTNDLNTWYSFEDARDVVEYFDGLAFLLGDGVFGVDLDEVPEDVEKYENGEASGIVYEFISTLGSYAEISPSGKGVHIICKGTLPPGGRRKKNVEMYDSARFFTVTGNALFYDDFKDCTESIKPLYKKYIGTNNKADEIISSLKNDLLFQGHFEKLGYNSQSEADLALCNKLAIKCGGDADLMDTVFRASGLYRDKWERADYRTTTIKKALENAPVISSGYDDTGNAERFARRYSGELYYCSDVKKWVYYNEQQNKWCFDDNIRVKKMFDQVINEMKYEQTWDKEELAKHIKNSRSSRKKRDAITEAQHLMPIKLNYFDSRLDLINLENGYLNLNDCTFNSSNKDCLFMQVMGTYYDKNSKAPTWERFLREIFLGDTELIEYVQKLAGYTLSGDISEQIIVVLFGSGRNGKSIFTEALREVFGDYSANMDIKTLMIKGATNSSSDIARLKGKRFVSTSESNEGARLDEGLVKQLTGGDMITARNLYESETEFTPQCTIYMTTNHKPIIRGLDDGIWRRMVLIPFNYKVPDNKIDKHLKSKLLQEKSGILNWLLEGYKKYKADGLKIPERCKKELEEYKLEMDSIARFIDERCIVEERATIKASELYLNYCSWANVNKEYVMTSTKFGREMSKKFERRKASGLYYVGLRLNI